MNQEEVIDYARTQYGVEVDCPFSGDEGYLVLRHPDNRKWFGLLGSVEGVRLGLAVKEKIDVLNLKCDPMLASVLHEQDGIMPAYHMNKEHWITVLLDCETNPGLCVPDAQLEELIDASWQLTSSKRRKHG